MYNAVNEREKVTFGLDNVICPKFISGLTGGRSLDVTDFPLNVISAGHVIIVKDGVYKPMPLQQKTEDDTPVTDADGNPVYEYASLPASHAYAGILYRSILTKKPAASIMTNGQLNSVAAPYDMASILSAFKAACPFIEFVKDEEAI